MANRRQEPRSAARRVDFDALSERRRPLRMAVDRLLGRAVGVGGIGVFVALMLIFLYLAYVVFPLFVPADAEHVADFPRPGEGATRFLALDEQAELGLRISAAGEAIFFSAADGAIRERLPTLPGGAQLTTLAREAPDSDRLALGLGDGRALLLQYRFQAGYQDNVRHLSPQLRFPYGEEPLQLDPRGEALRRLAWRDGAEQLLAAAVTDSGRVVLTRFRKQVNFLDGDSSLGEATRMVVEVPQPVDFILVGPAQRHLYLAAGDGRLLNYDISGDEPVRLQQVQLVEPGRRLTALGFLVGGVSLLAGDSAGHVGQWFPVRDADNRPLLRFIRGFDAQSAAITALAAEPRRKGFYAADATGRVGIYHATAAQNLRVDQVGTEAVAELALSPRADAFLAQTGDGRMHLWRVDNDHPEISWAALWEKVHYEGYDEPRYIWQSSAATTDVEPKFSLTPLSFGTLKAALYAMAFAVPLAILGAVYTAYFMTPRMRRVVKPTIEIMEALPTVILGFLAGLWLAPLVERYLPGIFALLFLMPLGILAFAFAWRRLSRRLSLRVPEGWEAALLIPAVVVLAALILGLSQPLEALFFDGDMRAWLTRDLGIDFDQRNSLVVGFAMGFAVIPTIFSITEDAIFSVPKHLTFGSLALGATPWQTLTRVVILTASPGIFSAVMIGLGRAVGETMIVLMATGNTPIMDLNIFEGMRTLSANIAVEMPESEVHSTHYRVLFLAALVLFLFTFVFNTVAELVRQRLRRMYSSL